MNKTPIDSLESRLFFIDDGNGNTIQVNVELNSVLPIMDIGKFVIDNHTVDNFNVTNTEPSNKPKDPEYENENNGDDRFLFVIIGKSFYSDIMVSVYYDRKYNDFIYFNHPDYFNCENRNNQILTLNGYRVGMDTVTDTTRSLLTFSKRNLTKLQLPEPSKIRNYEIYVLNLHGIETRHVFRNRFAIGNNQYYKQDNFITFARLKVKDLGDEALPVNDFYITDIQKFQTSYVGYRKPTYVYIPILL